MRQVVAIKAAKKSADDETNNSPINFAFLLVHNRSTRLAIETSELCPSRTSLVPGLFYIHFCGPKKDEKMVRPTLLEFFIWFCFFMGSDDVLLQWKSAGAYHTFPRKKKSNGFALLPFLTKAKVNCVERVRALFFYFTWRTTSSAVWHQKRNQKSCVEMYNNVAN